ncbi:unnamed protein product [Cuscuta campestris]|uniref:Uncharacterized protein n=1 Tax=Cuscuta campestris TaxID=132261 RepID=A0A484LRH4_9ASTE|nr:unnamed protein product [Cuscuta campestris]
MEIAYQKAIQHLQDNAPIQFLNACCRFYELAAFLVDGTVRLLEEIPADLLETRRWLQERIDAAEKDKEVKEVELYNNQIQQMGRDLELLKDVFGRIITSGDDILPKEEDSKKQEQEEEEEVRVVPSSARKWENDEEENLIQVLDSVLRCLEREEELVMSASSEIEQHSVRHYLEIFRTEEREEREAIQWLLDSDESILSSVNIKLTKALKQLLASKELLLDLEHGLGLEDNNGNKENNHNNNNDVVAIEDGDNNAFSSLRRFQQVLTDFEDTVLACLASKCARIAELERQLQELAHPIASLKKKKGRYKKAFLARCRSLHLAESEVDMLGDQVDSLLQFLEKICRKLSKNSSFLSCHFEVSDMVRLIKKELRNCTAKIDA